MNCDFKNCSQVGNPEIGRGIPINFICPSINPATGADGISLVKAFGAQDLKSAIQSA